jgi:hypothetical protein
MNLKTAWTYCLSRHAACPFTFVKFDSQTLYVLTKPATALHFSGLFLALQHQRSSIKLLELLVFKFLKFKGSKSIGFSFSSLYCTALNPQKP